MNDVVEIGARAVPMGIAGAALMDAWGLLLRRGFSVSTLDYAMLGRWVGHFPRGRFVHSRIASAPPIPGERLLGWAAHYAIGITFAWLLFAIWGLGWSHSPTIWPPLVIGAGTVVAPWFVMQPAIGVGIAGSHSANPRLTRVRNLGTHAVYGLGLYLAAVALSGL
jgi:hypothetical protein